MKKVLSVLVAVLLMVAVCVPAFAASTTLSVSAPETANVGDTITVTVSQTGLSGNRAVLTFDTASYSYVDGSIAAGAVAGSHGFNVDNAATGSIVDAWANGAGVSDGVLFTVQLKVLKTGGKISVASTDALDADDNQVESKLGGTQSVTVAAPAATTAATETTTAASGSGSGSTVTTTSKAAATTSKTTTKIPKTGGSVSVAACGVTVLAMAAAVAYTMKKKSEDK